MEYLLVMSLSGSAMTGIYLLLRFLLRKRVCARLYDLLARAAILYYLIPLPYLKKYYVAALRVFCPEKALEISRVPLTWRNHVVHAEGSMHVNIFAILQTTAAVVWISGICLLMAKQVAEYLMLVRFAAKYADRAMTPEQRAFLGGLKEQYGIRRRVFLYEAPDKEYTMTFGWMRSGKCSCSWRQCCTGGIRWCGSCAAVSNGIVSVPVMKSRRRTKRKRRWTNICA